MANTAKLETKERKKKKREARIKNKKLFHDLSKENRKKFLTQVHDKKAKNKMGIVSFTENIKKEKEAKKAEA
jgi:hypothetical protein